MQKSEIDRVFALLAQFYPNSQQVKSTSTRGAWWLALEPYDYADVKAAVVSHARRSNYFPDVYNITSALTLKQESAPISYSTLTEKEKSDFNKMLAWYAERQKKFHAAGIPTAAEAKAKGISDQEWERMADSAGL